VKPVLEQILGAAGHSTVKTADAKLGERYFSCEGDVPLLFTDNETNNERLFGVPNGSPYVKDGIHNYVIHGQQSAVNPQQRGTKVSPHYRLNIPAGESRVVRLRLSDVAPTGSKACEPFGSRFEQTLQQRRAEGLKRPRCATRLQFKVEKFE
jgi:hypothetical protein